MVQLFWSAAAVAAAAIAFAVASAVMPETVLAESMEASSAPSKLETSSAVPQVQAPAAVLESDVSCLAVLLALRWDDLPDDERKALGKLGIHAAAWDGLSLNPLPQWSDIPQGVRSLIKSAGGVDETEWDCAKAAIDAPVIQQGNLRDLRFEAAGRVPWDLGIVAPRGLETVKLGVYQEVWSALVAFVAARLLAGVWGVQIEFVSITDGTSVAKLQEGSVDLVLDSPDLNHLGVRRFSSAAERQVHLHGDLAFAVAAALLITLPRTSQSRYAAMRNKFWSWQDLKDGAVKEFFPRSRCTMGPWTEGPKDYGTWCDAPSKGKELPVIWAQGPLTASRPVREMMVFLHTMKLAYAIEFLEDAELWRRSRLAALSGRPALLLLPETAAVVGDVEFVVHHVRLPGGRPNCGHIGNWTHLGEWFCGSAPQKGSKLSRTGLPAPLLNFVDSFDLDHHDSQELVHSFRSELSLQGDTQDYSAVLQRAADRWAEQDGRAWRNWFKPRGVAEASLSSGRNVVLIIMSVGFAAFLLSELCYRAPRRPKDDLVDRSEPPHRGLEMAAGFVDTCIVILRGVTVASVLCSVEATEPFQGIALKHVLIGHFASQLITACLSKYETPITSPALEIIPILKVVLMKLEVSLVGCGREAVFVTLLFVSALITLLSGLVTYAIGVARAGNSLRFMPYVVELGIQGAIGVVLLDIGIEASCGKSHLEMLSAMEFGVIGSRSIVLHWLPALLCALVLFVLSKRLGESPLRLIGCMGAAIVGFHIVRMLYGASLADAISAGWLFPPCTESPPLALYRTDVTQIYWAAVLYNLPSIMTAVFVIVVVKVGMSLAVTSALIPPEAIGKSSFDFEMTVQGRSHILAGLVGGFSSDFGNDDIMMHRMLGGRSRKSVFYHLGSMVLALVWGGPFEWALSMIPKFVTGIIVMIVGLELLVFGVIEARHILARSEFTVVVAMLVTVFMSGGKLEVTMVVGILLGFLDFVVRYTRSTGTPVFLECGVESAGLVRLEGALFFATAPVVVDEIVTQVEEQGLRVLVLDFTRVTGMDTKGALECRRLCGDRSPHLIMFGLRLDVNEVLRAADVIEDTHFDVQLAEVPGTSSTSTLETFGGESVEVGGDLPTVGEEISINTKQSDCVGPFRSMSQTDSTGSQSSRYEPQVLRVVDDLDSALAMAVTLLGPASTRFSM